MKLATAKIDGLSRPVVIDRERAWDLLAAVPNLPDSMDGWIEGWPQVGPTLVEHLDAAPARDLNQVTLCAPLQAPRKVLCVGRNYADHALEQGAEIPAEPVIFSKLNTALSGPHEPIQLPKISQQVDFEAELVVVIGRQARQVTPDQAMDHVFGYTCGNDVTARDWQKGRPGGQWLLGKSFDTFGPIGPWIVTADQLDRVPELDITLRLNGEVMQSSNTRHFMYPIHDLIAHLSQFCTLQPGDLLFTGTPAGVGMARDPQVFLQAGDQVTVELEQIGTLTNPVVAP